MVNIYIAYELGASSSHIDDPTLKNCLFGAITLTKNTDIDKYGLEYGLIHMVWKVFRLWNWVW